MKSTVSKSKKEKGKSNRYNNTGTLKVLFLYFTSFDFITMVLWLTRLDYD